MRWNADLSTKSRIAWSRRAFLWFFLLRSKERTSTGGRFAPWLLRLGARCPSRSRWTLRSVIELDATSSVDVLSTFLTAKRWSQKAATIKAPAPPFTQVDATHRAACRRADRGQPRAPGQPEAGLRALVLLTGAGGHFANTPQRWNSKRAPTFASHSSLPGATSTRSKPMIFLPLAARRERR